VNLVLCPTYRQSEYLFCFDVVNIADIDDGEEYDVDVAIARLEHVFQEFLVRIQTQFLREISIDEPDSAEDTTDVLSGDLYQYFTVLVAVDSVWIVMCVLVISISCCIASFGFRSKSRHTHTK
jgi:hypothetical protein